MCDGEATLKNGMKDGEVQSSKHPTDVLLVQMPEGFLTPCLALSLLKQGIVEEGLSCRVEYASHFFVRHLGWDLYERGQKLLGLIAGRGWELLFSAFTGFRPAVSEDAIFDMMLPELTGQFGYSARLLVDQIRQCFQDIKDLLPSYLEAEAERILAGNPAVVGFSVMTQQRNASFAMCRLLKQKRPELVTIMGGAVCTPDTAPWFLKAAPDLDFVFTGEGDRALALVCRTILEGKRENLKDFDFLAGRGSTARYLCLDRLDDSPFPDFSDYLEILKDDPFRDRIRSQVPLEASRGCWWAEKNRCRFCGLHYCPESARYRCKSPERFWEEADRVFAQTGISEFQLTDCILNQALIRALPEKKPSHREKYVLSAECRSSLKDAELKKLAENGFVVLQPGIESLQDELLELMNKGCRTEGQLMFLIRCAKYGIKPVWNIICHIPGEQDRMYEEMLILMRKIHHLYPPSCVNRMLLARGSVYHLQAERFGLDVNIRVIDLATDPDDEGFTRATADYFYTTAPGISPAMEQLLRQEHALWRRDYFRNHVSLTCRCFPDRTEISDRRNPEKPSGFVLTGDSKRVFDAVLEITDRRELSALLGGGEAALEAILSDLDSKNLLFMKDGKVLALAVPANTEPDEESENDERIS